MQFRRVHGGDSAQVVTPFVQVGTYRQGIRYLRMVIVTTAVYWGLSFQLALRLTNPLNLPAPAGVSPYTSSYDLHGPVFLVNSRLSLVSAANSRFGSNPYT